MRKKGARPRSQKHKIEVTQLTQNQSLLQEMGQGINRCIFLDHGELIVEETQRFNGDESTSSHFVSNDVLQVLEEDVRG